MFSIDFENFQNFQFLSFFIIFGVRVACFSDFSFLFEHFWQKLPDTIVPGEKLCLWKTNCQTCFKTSFFDPKKRKRLSHRNLQLAENAPVLLEVGGELSTELPPRRLVEQMVLFIFSKYECHEIRKVN